MKMENAHKSHLVAKEELFRKQPTLKSHKEHGYDYHIVNEFLTEDTLKFTAEQANSMFRQGLPLELLILIPTEDAIALHNWRMKNDESYSEIFKKLNVKETKPAAKKESK